MPGPVHRDTATTIKLMDALSAASLLKDNPPRPPEPYVGPSCKYQDGYARYVGFVRVKPGGRGGKWETDLLCAYHAEERASMYHHIESHPKWVTFQNAVDRYEREIAQLTDLAGQERLGDW